MNKLYKKLYLVFLLFINLIFADTNIVFDDSEIVTDSPPSLTIDIPVIGPLTLMLVVDPSDVIYRLKDVEKTASAGPVTFEKISSEIKIPKQAYQGKVQASFLLTSEGTFYKKRVKLGIKELQQDPYKTKGQLPFRLVKFGMDFIETKPFFDLIETKSLVFESADLTLEKRTPALLEARAELAGMPAIARLSVNPSFMNFNITFDQLILANLFDQLKKTKMADFALNSASVTFNVPLGDFRQPAKIEISSRADLTPITNYINIPGITLKEASISGYISNIEGLYLEARLDEFSVPPILTNFKNSLLKLTVPPPNKVVRETESGLVITANNFKDTDLAVRKEVYKPIAAPTV